MAPARSIQCIRRPPRSAASGLASLGSTISAISDCESRTGRGARLSSDIRLSLLAVERVLEDECSTLLFQVGIQKTLGHPLHACVSMLAQPGCTRKVKLQFTMFYGKMIAFADVKQAKSTHRSVGCRKCVALWVGRRGDRKPYRVPDALWRSPTATAGIAEIAESLQNVVSWSFTFVTRRSAVAAPSASEGQSRRVRPAATFQLGYRHEIRTGQISFASDVDLQGNAIVISPGQSDQHQAPGSERVVVICFAGKSLMDRIATLN